MRARDNGYVGLGRFNALLDIVVGKIRANEQFKPDTIVALSTGGFPVAAALAKQLSIPSRRVVGLPAYRDETGDYHLDSQLVSLGDCSGRQVLVVDEASNSGGLARKAVEAVMTHGGIAKSCVLIAWGGGLQPDFVAETCPAEPPKFYWEPPRQLNKTAKPAS